MKKTAIVLGATGLTGSLLLKKLIEDDYYSKIIVFSRREIESDNPKINNIVCDLMNLEQYKKDFFADDLFCCIGTTTKKTPDKKLYYKIDYGIPISAASLCKENNISTFIIISSVGANHKSPFFYTKTKGEMEKSLLDKKIKNTYILQPSVIIGKRNESRFLEKIGLNFLKLINPLLFASLKKYRSVNADSIANAMFFLAKNGYQKNIIESDEIIDISKKLKK